MVIHGTALDLRGLDSHLKYVYMFYFISSGVALHLISETPLQLSTSVEQISFNWIGHVMHWSCFQSYIQADGDV